MRRLFGSITYTWLAAFAVVVGGTSAPVSADVLEIDDSGVVHVRASDGGVRPSAATAPEQAGEVTIPAEALTLVGGSGAPSNYVAAVEHVAALNHLSPALVDALVWQESRWRANARSPVGAIGLAQLMPGTARELGVNPHDPHANLAGGARYLRQQLDRFDGDIERALAAYNAGPGRVIRARGIPAIRETQAYVVSIVDRLAAPMMPQGVRR